MNIRIPLQLSSRTSFDLFPWQSKISPLLHTGEIFGVLTFGDSVGDIVSLEKTSLYSKFKFSFVFS